MAPDMYSKWLRTGLLQGFNEDNRHLLADRLEEFVQMWMQIDVKDEEKEFSGKVALCCLRAIRQLFDKPINMRQLYDDGCEEARQQPEFMNPIDIDAEAYVTNNLIKKYQ